MRRVGPAIGVMLVVLFARPPVGHAAPLEGAAALGDEKFTVHLDGLLTDVLKALSKTTKREIWLQGAREPGEPQPPGAKPVTRKGMEKATAPVKLDFDNAPLAEILGSVCKQAGVIGEVDDAEHVRLREGDPNLDARPTANVGDYVLRVDKVTYNCERTYTLERGAGVPEAPEETGSLELHLGITSKSPQADQLLAGIGLTVKATTDLGGTLKPDREPDPEDPPDAMEPIERHGAEASPMPLDHVPDLRFAQPPPGVKKLTRVEGILYLYSTVKTTELKLPLAEKGKASRQDDVAVTIVLGKGAVPEMPPGVEMMQLDLEVDAPALPGAPKPRRQMDRSTQFDAVLVGKDGARRRGMDAPLAIAWTESKTQHKAFWFFLTEFRAAPDVKAAKFEPDYLLLTVRRGGPADKKLPFVFENVPVP